MPPPPSSRLPAPIRLYGEGGWTLVAILRPRREPPGTYYYTTTAKMRSAGGGEAQAISEGEGEARRDFRASPVVRRAGKCELGGGVGPIRDSPFTHNYSPVPHSPRPRHQPEPPRLCTAPKREGQSTLAAPFSPSWHPFLEARGRKREGRAIISPAHHYNFGGRGWEGAENAGAG